MVIYFSIQINKGRDRGEDKKKVEMKELGSNMWLLCGFEAISWAVTLEEIKIFMCVHW